MPQQSLNHPQSYASVGEGRGVTKDVSCCDSVNVGAPGGMSKTGFKKKKKKVRSQGNSDKSRDANAVAWFQDGRTAGCTDAVSLSGRSRSLPPEEDFPTRVQLSAATVPGQQRGRKTLPSPATSQGRF